MACRLAPRWELEEAGPHASLVLSVDAAQEMRTRREQLNPHASLDAAPMPDRRGRYFARGTAAVGTVLYRYGFPSKSRPASQPAGEPASQPPAGQPASQPASRQASHQPAKLPTAIPFHGPLLDQLHISSVGCRWLAPHYCVSRFQCVIASRAVVLRRYPVRARCICIDIRASMRNRCITIRISAVSVRRGATDIHLAEHRSCPSICLSGFVISCLNRELR